MAIVLLDTNALIAFAEGGRFRAASQAALSRAMAARELAVSATAAWEVGLLATRTGRTSAIFRGDARAWFASAVVGAGLQVVPFSAQMALEAVYLPDAAMRDPADRWTVAVARVMGATLITSDRAILAYAAAGHVDAVRL